MLKWKFIIKQKGHHIILKGSIHQEDVIVLNTRHWNLYVNSIRTTKYIQWILSSNEKQVENKTFRDLNAKKSGIFCFKETEKISQKTLVKLYVWVCSHKIKCSHFS